MIIWLLQWLSEMGIKAPAVFGYTSFRMLMAASTCLVLTIFIGPYFIRLLYQMKIGQKIRKEDCEQLWKLHEKKEDTPTMGGVLILVSMLTALFLWMDWTSSYTLLFLVATIILGFVGGLDDWLKIKKRNTKGVSGKTKLVFQFIVGALIASFLLSSSFQDKVSSASFFKPLVVKERIEGQMEKVDAMEYASRIYIPFFKEPVQLTGVVGAIIAFCFMVFVIMGSSNAVNLTDGLDGLASGCIIIASVALAIVAFISNNIQLSRFLQILYIEGSSEIAIYMCALAGATLGFLWYNAPPAQIFMGDIGSLSLGGLLGITSVLLKREFLLAFVGGIFVLEALSVIIQVGYFRYTKGKRFFRCAPFHHHYEYGGMAETKVVIRFWIMALLFALLGLLTIKVQ